MKTTLTFVYYKQVVSRANRLLGALRSPFREAVDANRHYINFIHRAIRQIHTELMRYGTNSDLKAVLLIPLDVCQDFVTILDRTSQEALHTHFSANLVLARVNCALARAKHASESEPGDPVLGLRFQANKNRLEARYHFFKDSLELAALQAHEDIKELVDMCTSPSVQSKASGRVNGLRQRVMHEYLLPRLAMKPGFDLSESSADPQVIDPMAHQEDGVPTATLAPGLDRYLRPADQVREELDWGAWRLDQARIFPILSGQESLSEQFLSAR